MQIQTNTGIEGEFRVVVKRADGSVRLDTGVQKNLFLDNGIRFLLWDSPVYADGTKLNTTTQDGIINYFAHSFCAIGNGNKQPTKGDIALQAQVATSSYSKDPLSNTTLPKSPEHPNHVKKSYTKTYLFDSLVNKTITEVGLAATVIRSGTVPLLITRSLIKDKSGSPISVTILEGEILEVTYTLNMYIDIREFSGELQVTTTETGQDATETFEYKTKVFIPNKLVEYAFQPIVVPTHTVVYSYSVKETDSELSANYSLNSDDWNNLIKNNEFSDTIFNKLVGDSMWGSLSSSQTSTSALNLFFVERSFEKKHVKYKVVVNPYTWVAENGIRGIRNGNYTGSDRLNYVHYIFFKNKANGQGLKKKQGQRLEYEITHHVGRWGE